MRKCRWLMLLVCFLFAGCGTKFAYNNISWFAVSYIEDFVSLSNSQESELEARLDSLQAWHKETQLPLYISQLEAIQSITRPDMNSAFIVDQSEQIKNHIRAIVNKFAPDVYALSMQLSPKQDSEFLKNFREKQQDYYEERLSLNDEDSRERYRNRIEERLERWLGSVSKEQKQIIYTWSQKWVNTNDNWRQYQNNTYQDLTTLMEKKSDLHIAQPIIMNLLLNNEAYYPDGLESQLNKNMQTSAKFLVDIASVSSDKQWSYFMNELESLESTLMTLQE
ncbi:DNA polymerase III subunit alpha [Vibrio crassostreae]|nr:DNA polymerase III subunit alpha [Vibrio crassostreae]CAK2707573.1 DNA polymerase III subunit alpha [Vibrio crassostreae]CAK2708307.1 DNA polymerase III subunit alpha [Vibrio crassostreae]CAK2712032.1 DNA polymerase III subunit alpha [Vibrio crassostreae]CAK2712731.1 DNA polymerase III subunit alpha [Vibrio crassostreae]